jgi:esterase
MNLADDVAVVVAHAPTARIVVGMSLGGLTAMELAVRHPALVRSLVMVDITPGVNAAKTKAITDFVDGPQEFASFDDLLARTKEHNPTRSESSLRRGILHNAHQRPTDLAVALRPREPCPSPHRTVPTTASAADARCRIRQDSGERCRRCGTTSVRSSARSRWCAARCRRWSTTTTSPRPADAAPITVHVVDGAGHSVQGDRPVELAALLADH